MIASIYSDCVCFHAGNQHITFTAQSLQHRIEVGIEMEEVSVLEGASRAYRNGPLCIPDQSSLAPPESKVFIYCV